MRYPYLLLSYLIFFGCNVEKKEHVSLLDCVPQNTLVTLQLNDQNMLRSALNNLPFIEHIFQLNDDFYTKIKSVLPESFAPNALLCITPEGKAALAASLFTKLLQQIAYPYLTTMPRNPLPTIPSPYKLKKKKI